MRSVLFLAATSGLAYLGSQNVMPATHERVALSRNGYTLPDRRLTPGAVLPVTAAQVCRAGYARSVRHPYDNAWRRFVYRIRRKYGVQGRGYTMDHVVALEEGGAPFSPLNVWPQPKAEAKVKDRVENRLHEMICAGAISLQDAQREESTDWTRTEAGLP